MVNLALQLHMYQQDCLWSMQDILNIYAIVPKVCRYSPEPQTAAAPPPAALLVPDLRPASAAPQQMSASAVLP
jgi:hypothetical protein